MSKTTSTKNGRIVETIQRFNDGMTSDIRNSDGFALSKHFYHYPDRLQLRPGSEEDTSLDDCTALCLADNDVYALGTEGASTGVHKKGAVFLGSFSYVGSATFADDTWLFEYKNYLFYIDGGDDLAYFGDITGSPTETANFKTGLTTSRGSFDFVKPFIHPSDDYAYFFDRNNIFQLTDEPTSGTWTQASIVIPDHLSITAACPFGEYVAIFGYDHQVDKTTLFIWDRSLTLTDFVDVVEWGSGEVLYAASLGGNLTGISKINGARKMMRASVYSGTHVQTVKELVADGTILGTTFNESHAFVVNDKMYFGGLDVKLGASTRGNVIYQIDHLFNITIAYAEDDAVQSLTSFIVDEESFMVANSAGVVYHTTALYTILYPGEYTTPVFDGNIGYEYKSPQVVRVWHSPIGSSGSIKIEYYCEEVGDWTEIGTNSTQDDTRTSFVRVTSDDSHIRQSREHIYRVTATDVKEVYGIQAESEIINNAN